MLPQDMRKMWIWEKTRKNSKKISWKEQEYRAEQWRAIYTQIKTRVAKTLKQYEKNPI